MITLQDRYIGINKIEKALNYINEDKRTCVCASDIAQFIDEYYPEMFENIASDEKAYAHFNYMMDVMRYYSFTEIAEDYLADHDNLNNYSFFNQLALDFGYDNFDEFSEYYLTIYDSALDGVLVFDM